MALPPSTPLPRGNGIFHCPKSSVKQNSLLLGLDQPVSSRGATVQVLGIDPSQSLSDQSLLDVDLPDPEIGHASAIAVSVKHLDLQLGSPPNQFSQSLCGLGSPRLVSLWSIKASQPDALTIKANGVSIRDVDSTALQEGNQQQNGDERWAESAEKSEHC